MGSSCLEDLAVGLSSFCTPDRRLRGSCPFQSSPRSFGRDTPLASQIRQISPGWFGSVEVTLTSDRFFNVENQTNS